LWSSLFYSPYSIKSRLVYLEGIDYRILSGGDLVAAEVDERSSMLLLGLRSAVLRLGRLGCPNLPVPRVVVDNLDVLLVQEHLSCLLSSLVVMPCAEVDEDAKMFTTIAIGLLHDIDALDVTETNGFEDTADALFSDVSMHPWDAEAGLRRSNLRKINGMSVVSHDTRGGGLTLLGKNEFQFF